MRATSRKVLVIEDDAEVRASLTAALEESGAEVIGANDAPDGLAQLRAGADPAVIVLDIRVARRTAEAFLRELRADARFEHLPVISLSSTCDDFGAWDRGPFDMDDVLGIVLSLFETRTATA